MAAAALVRVVNQNRMAGEVMAPRPLLDWLAEQVQVYVWVSTCTWCEPDVRLRRVIEGEPLRANYGRPELTHQELVYRLACAMEAERLVEAPLPALKQATGRSEGGLEDVLDLLA